jgi:hypothetical protein
MALLTLAELIDNVQDEIPGKEQALIVRACNKVIRRIQTELVEPSRSTFTTAASVTTGTVSVTQDSTTATFSSGVVLAADGFRMVQIEGDSTWFTLTRGAADTDGVLSSAGAKATDATATFTIVYPTVSLPNTVGEITDIRRVGEASLNFRASGGQPYTSGVPKSWSPFVHDEATANPSDDLTRIYLDPAPNARFVYTYWYKPRTPFIAVGAATTVTVPFSDLWFETIVQGTLFFLWKQEAQAEKALLASALYEAAFARARGAQLPSAVIKPRDSGRGVYAYEQRPVADA